MTEKYKKLKSTSVIILLISFTFLSFLVKVAIAEEVTDQGSSYPGIKGKIETTEQRLAEERFKLRLKEANEYMEKGDRYYAAGKLQEALGEWYAALALLDLLQERGAWTLNDTCTRLENQIKSRLSSEENNADPRRQAQIEKRVKEVLSRRMKEEQAAEKQKALTPNAEPVQMAAEPAVKIQESAALQELEVMKKNRQAVEEMISQDIAKDKDNIVPQAIIPAPEEGKASQAAMESSISQELASEKKVRGLEAAKNKRKEAQRAEEQKQLEAKKVLAQEESERLKEAQLTKQNEAFKSAVEESIVSERLEAKKGAQAQEQLKKEAEERTQAQLAQEAKKDQELRAKAEKLESDKMDDLIREKKKASQVESQLQALEKKTQTEQAKKQIAKKEKQKAKKSSIGQISGPSAPTGEVDKFDLIDKVLTSYDSYGTNDFRNSDYRGMD